MFLVYDLTCRENIAIVDVQSSTVLRHREDFPAFTLVQLLGMAIAYTLHLKWYVWSRWSVHIGL